MQHDAYKIQLHLLFALALLFAGCRTPEQQEPSRASRDTTQTTRQAREPIAPELITTMGAAASYMTQVHAQRAIEKDPWSVNHPDPGVGLPTPHPRSESWRRGVSLGLFASENSRKKQLKIYTMLLDEIVAVGATDISLVVRWKQRTIKDSEIFASDDVTSDDRLLIDVIAASNARGLRVFLMPIIYLEERGKGVWRGTIKPDDREAWWASYERFILHYADIAAAHDVALYSVGSELLSMEREQARWSALIGKVRARYNGELTYSANWDHFEVPTFWDLLDVAGMTAYQELTDVENPTVAQLNEGWPALKDRLDAWSRAHDRRFIFTEIGFPSHRLGAAHPWDYTSKALPAHDLQARCFRSMFETWHDDEALAGVYIWNWFGFRSPDDRGYTPRGKPSEPILKHWYSGPRQETPSPTKP